MEKLSYASESSTSPWTTYLRQIDRVAPYLGDLAYWVETLRHPKRALIVDIPVQMDDGTYRRPFAQECRRSARASDGAGFPPSRQDRRDKARRGRSGAGRWSMEMYYFQMRKITFP